MPARFKLITAHSLELFEERLNAFATSLERDDAIVDVKFSTAASSSGTEYCALVHYRQSEPDRRFA